MGIYRTLPNMTVIMPADYHSAKVLVKEAAAWYGPVYLRFTRDPIPFIYDENIKLTIGKAHQIREGEDICLIANGDVMSLAVQAAEQLGEKGITVRLLDMHTIKPLDTDAVTRALSEIGRIITIEDHNILNGLGSAVCEVAAEMGKGRVKRIGIQDQFGESAPYEYLLEKNGVSVDNIVSTAITMVEQEVR
jgi:transketolase